MSKRLFDIIVSTLGLIVASPIMLGVALCLRFVYGRPVLFKQLRVGLNGQEFQIHKFRTMTDRPGPLVTTGGDARVHVIGGVLRASKMDELPQLWDVLLGRMSVVGPRPEVPQFVNHWSPEERLVILSVRPGITDPASIAFRDEAALLARQTDPLDFYVSKVIPAKTAMYVDYVNSASVVTDLKILIQTALAVLRCEGSRQGD